MESQGIIRKVSQPTEWVNSIVYIRKKNGKLRLCLDPKDLNRAIMRCHYKTHTMEELVRKLSSRTLTGTEQRYANIERELLAVVFGCERFRTYLYGCKFQAESDHKPLEMISAKNLIAAPRRLQRMLLRLQEYDLSIIYRPGKEMTPADGFSRLPNKKTKEEINLNVRVDFVQFSTENLTQIHQATKADPILCELRETITFREISQNLQLYWSYRDELAIENGILMKDNYT